MASPLNNPTLATTGKASSHFASQTAMRASAQSIPRLLTFVAPPCRTPQIAVAAIITNALRERAANNVVIRIIYDATTEPDGDTAPTASPTQLEADKKVPGTDTFVRSFAQIAQIKGVTGYRVLMHSKYLVRDGDTDDAAVFLGSANYTNDSWGLQENNLLQIRSRSLAAYFSKNFTDLLAAGRIPERPAVRDVDTVRVADVAVRVAFAPEQSPAIIKEIVGAITTALARPRDFTSRR